MNDEVKNLVEKYSSEAKIAGVNDKVYKDECVYSFDTPESPNGLFVCLKHFISVSQDLLPIHFSKTQSHLYLHIKTWRKEIVKKDDDDCGEQPEKKKPSKLGIGIDGGFDLNEKQFEFENEYSLFIYPERKQVKLIEQSAEVYLTEHVRKSIESVVNAQSAYFKEELASQAAAWDGEKRFVSKHSQSLVQVPNPVQISPNPESWKCEMCDIRKNLWLNLTDGKILCGRKQLDGSGGNNHAIEHYQNTKHPLAVKLGTITASGMADVYSYDEDDMVEDVNLAVHLAHFGINMAHMQKSDKTMAELEIDLNQKIGEWDRIQETGSKLVPLYGPGFTGMRNLGNSCYMNSLMQVIFTLPDFVRKYVDSESRDAYLANSSINPSDDFNLQMAKLGHGLLSGVYSIDPEKASPLPAHVLRPPKGIKPTSFKTLIGRGHVEFSTKRQQDVHEYLTHLISLIERHGHASTKPCDAFRFQFEDRIECAQSRRVKYTKREDFCLSVPINKDATLNKTAYEAYLAKKQELAAQNKKPEPSDLVRQEIRLEDCIRLLSQTEVIYDFYSTQTKQKGQAYKKARLVNFPDYLFVQLKKFEFAPDWSPVKLDVSIQVPNVLDLSEYRSSGLQPNEEQLPEDADEPEEEPTFDEAIVSQLVDMGFSIEGSKRASYNTRDTKNAEDAVNWAVAHMEDDDFNAVFQVPKKAKKSAAKSSGVDEPSEESIASIMSWGFMRAQAIKALKATNNNMERAADWIFSHTDELMNADDDNQTTTSGEPSSSTTTTYRDGDGKYELIAFISHMGTNANVGHYVAHIMKEGKWCIFNDEMWLCRKIRQKIWPIFIYSSDSNIIHLVSSS